MYKKILALAGFFALAACGEDVYQDIDKQNEILEQSSNAPGNSGGIKPFTIIPGGYESPWHFSAPDEVNHFFHSPLPSNKGIAVRVTPYIGLAYWDGGDDGIYNTPGGVYNLTSGMYPNLYNGGNEYGNYIEANPIVLNVWGVGGPHTEELGIIWGGHCPVFTAWTYTYNWHSIFFDVMNNGVIQPSAMVGGLMIPATPATFQEAQLLNRYGKVMYYKVEFGFNATPNLFTETVYVLALEVDDLTTPDWSSLSITDTPFGGDLYYSTTGSEEIVVDRSSSGLLNNPQFYQSGETFTISLGSFTITTWYDGPGTGSFVWLWIE